MERKSLKSSCGSSLTSPITCRSDSGFTTPQAPPERSVYCSTRASGDFSCTRVRARRLTGVGTAFPGRRERAERRRGFYWPAAGASTDNLEEDGALTALSRPTRGKLKAPTPEYGAPPSKAQASSICLPAAAP